MNRAFCLACLTLICWPGLAFGQQLFHSLSKYDRTTDTTTVECELISDELSGHLNLQAFVSFRGKRAGETLHCWLAVSTSYSKATRKTPTQFHNASHLTLHLDDETMAMPVKDYRKEYYELIQRLCESVNVELAQDQWSKILAAKHLTAEWGNAQFVLNDKALVSLKAFLQRYAFARSGNSDQ